MNIVYISGPYTAPTESQVYDNIQFARQYAIKYWNLGYAVICPHMNSAFMGGVASNEPWLDGDITILRRCNSFDTIVMIPGWRHSPGALKELAVAEEIGMNVVKY